MNFASAVCPTDINALEFEPCTMNEIVNLFDRHRNQTQIREVLRELKDHIVIEERKTAGRPEMVVSLGGRAL